MGGPGERLSIQFGKAHQCLDSVPTILSSMLTNLGIDYIALLAHFSASTLPAPVFKAGPDWISWHRVPPRASTTATRPDHPSSSTPISY
ncbi:hypothetical protein D5086_020745 [Populus alba]|uniref:Uncharacterized protein n=1 Tax=Populus alba TaxID=43335 RepID=A0ACC4BLL0_POPAL